MSSFLVLLCSYIVTYYYVAADEGQVIDSFYDDIDEANWVIFAGTVTDEMSYKWNDMEAWDTINENLKTQKGHVIDRKCVSIFEMISCLCQFKRITGVSHNCEKNARQTRSRSIPNPVSRGISTAQSAYTNSYNNRQNVIQNVMEQLTDDEKLDLEEQVVEDEIAAAEVELDNNVFIDEDLDEIAEDLSFLIDAEKERVEEGMEDDEEVYDEWQDDIDTDTDIEDDDGYADAELDADALEYDAQMIGVLDEEVETQGALIDRQNELIQELKHDNAMKEELIEVLDEDESDFDDRFEENEDGYEDEDYEDEDMYEDEDIFDDAYEDEENEYDNDEYYDDDDAAEADAEYYDDIADEESFEQEDYNELYDVDGEDREEYVNEYGDNGYGDYEHEEEASNLEQEEAEAMLADTFRGLEIYAVAFMVLCCCCVVCYSYKTKCCGYFKKQEDNKSFGYARYANSGGFNRVFGGVDDDMEDVEMGKVDQNESEEAEALQS